MNLSTDAHPTNKQTAAESATVRKFLFDRSFDDASIVHRAQERKPVLMKPEQVDALKKEAYDEGFLAGQAAGKDEQTAHLDGVFDKVDRSIQILIRSMIALGEYQQTHTRQLVLAIAQKILPAFTATAGLQEIEALLNTTIREMAREPRLVVRVHEGEFDAVNERVQAIATQRAYPGKVIVLADADVAAGDCRIEWADGGVERNTDDILKLITKTILPPT